MRIDLHRIRPFFRDLVADFGESDLLTDASAIGFSVLFAIIPSALFAVALLGFLDLEPVWSLQLSPGVRATLGDPVFAVVDGSVRQVLSARQGFWLTLGLALAVWELSATVRAIATALNRIYSIADARSFGRWLATSVGLGLAVGGCLLAAAFALFSGPQVTEWLLGPSSLAGVVGFLARWAIALGAMVLAVGLLLRYAPGERVDWPWVGTGALATVAVWAVGSLGFEAYLTWVASYGSVYGGLATPFVLLLYLYLAALAFLFGVWVERRQRNGVNRPLKSPPHDTEDG